MPYYVPDNDRELAEKLVKTNVCAECGRRLYVYVDMSNPNHPIYVACPTQGHEGIRNTYPDELKQRRQQMSMDSKALMKLGEGGMLARIEQAKFPQALKQEEKKLVAEIALSYGLDPIMNELSIYQGRPYPTVNAWYRKSQETGQFDGINSRPATKQEREERNAKVGDLLYCVEVWRKGCSHPFVGWGRVRAEETKGDSHLPIVKDPDRMAEKRGEMQGMRKAFSIPMPPLSFEEATYIEGEARVITEETTSPLETVIEEQPAEGGRTTEKDESPITKEQATELQTLLNKAKMSGQDLWKACKDSGWTITKIGDLKVWQFEELKARINKGLEEQPALIK